MKRSITLLALLAILSLSATAYADRQPPLAFSKMVAVNATGGETPLHAQFDPLDPFDDEAEYDAAEDTMISDPLEGWNRFWFSFNDVLLLKIIKPLHKGYSYVTPEKMRLGIRNVFFNLLFPVRFVSSILQGKFSEAGYETSRFVLNTTLGAGGIMDLAKDKRPLVEFSDDPEDLGQAFGNWGIGEGIYLVWPFIGPSTARDTVGFIGDGFLDPVSYVTPLHSSIGLKAGARFNSADKTIEQYEEIKKAAIEPYSAVRNAYVQYRRSLVAK